MIQDEAVEAAQVVMVEAFERCDITDTYSVMDYTRRALEAAAPHMMAEAWDVGYGYGRNGDFTNPYRSAK